MMLANKQYMLTNCLLINVNKMLHTVGRRWKLLQRWRERGKQTGQKQRQTYWEEREKHKTDW